MLVFVYYETMYVDIVPNRTSPPAVLLRESRREGGKIVKTTLANLSTCPPEAVEALRLALRGVALVPHEEVFAVERSIPHGHVQAVLGVMRTVGMDALLAARPCRERDLVLAMIAQRLLDPCSKLATTRVWHTTTLAQELGVDDADANDLYAALDWLQQRQGRIEKKLATRHLTDGAVVLFDVSSWPDVPPRPTWLQPRRGQVTEHCLRPIDRWCGAARRGRGVSGQHRRPRDCPGTDAPAGSGRRGQTPPRCSR